MHEDTIASLLPNRHLDRADALPSFLFEIPFSTPFLDLSAIVVWWHLLAFQQLFSSFSWAFFVRVLPQNHGKLHLLGMKRHRLTFLLHFTSYGSHPDGVPICCPQLLRCLRRFVAACGTLQEGHSFRVRTCFVRLVFP